MGIFDNLRDQLFACKVQNRTFDDVDACKKEALIVAEQAMELQSDVAELLSCPGKLSYSDGMGERWMERDIDIPDFPNRHDLLLEYINDIQQIAEIGSFDTEDIKKGYPWQCETGAIQETSIDRIDLKDGQTYLVKHSGSASDPVSDAQTWQGVQLVANILGEEIPKLVWANAKTGRFAMTWMPASSGQTSFYDVLPHDLVTTLIFETIIGDWDREKPDNAVRVGDVLFGHLDFAGAHTGGDPEPASRPATHFLNEIKYSSLDVIEQDYPGITEAMLQGHDRWSKPGGWYDQLTKLHMMPKGDFWGDSTDEGSVWLPLTAPERLDAVSEMFRSVLGDTIKQRAISGDLSFGDRPFDVSTQAILDKVRVDAYTAGGTDLRDACVSIAKVNFEIPNYLSPFTVLLWGNEVVADTKIDRFKQVTRLCGEKQLEPFVNKTMAWHLLDEMEEAGNKAVQTLVTTALDHGGYKIIPPSCTKQTTQFKRYTEDIACARDLCRANKQQIEDLWAAIDEFTGRISFVEEQLKIHEAGDCKRLEGYTITLGVAKKHLDSVLEDISLEGHCTTRLGGTLHRETDGDWNVPIRMPLDRWHLLWDSIKEQLADCVTK